MANEIEAKMSLSEVELESLERKLRKQDKSFGGRMLERNMIFVAPWMQNGEYARIRLWKFGLVHMEGYINPYPDRYATITYKGANNGKDVSNREELEFKILGHDGPVQLFSKWGFKPYSTYAKKRSIITLPDDVKIFLDSVCQESDAKLEPSGYVDSIDSTKSKHFMEIEAPTEDKVLDVIKQLGLQEKPIIKQSYAQIFARSK